MRYELNDKDIDCVFANASQLLRFNSNSERSKNKKIFLKEDNKTENISKKIP